MSLKRVGKWVEGGWSEDGGGVGGWEEDSVNGVRAE